MKTFKTFVCALVVAAGMTGVAAAADGKGFAVRAGVAGVLPDEGASIGVIGGDVEISDEYVPALILSYGFTDRIGVELFCCLAPHEVKAVGTAAGTVDLGEITLFPPIVTGTYKFITEGPVQPYVGAGVNFTTFFNEDLPSSSIATSIDYDDSFGPAIQIGADFPINENWFVNVDLKKVWIQTDVTVNGAIKADVDIDPLITFVGVGYRF